MNREQRRKLNLSTQESKVLTDLVNMAKIKKALDEYKPLAEGTKVKLNFEQISGHPDYSRLVPKYREWVESHKDEEFTVVHNTNPNITNTVFLKNNTETSIWTFWEGDLIVIEEGNK